MMGARVCSALVAGLLLAASPVSSQERFDWDQQMASGDFLEVKGISGDIRTVLSPDGTARVTAEKRGRTGDFERVQIVVEEHRNGVTVCAHYGYHDEPADHCDHDHHDDRDHGRNRRIDVSVDFLVQVPAGVEFEGSMVSGDVRAEGLRSDVTATSVSGNVEVSTTGVARASTVSGSIDVEMGSDDWDDLDYHTVSGNITVYMPSDIGAEVRFESLSGDIDADFPISMDRSDRRWAGSRVRGTIGDGSRRMSFRTVSGDVRLRALR